MILKNITGNRIGKLIPDLFLTNVTIEPLSSGIERVGVSKKSEEESFNKKINKISINFNFRDFLENYNFSWFDNKDLIKNLKIKNIIITDKKVYSDFISKPDSITSSKYIKSFADKNTTVFKVSDDYFLFFAKNYKDIKQTYPVVDENGSNFFYFNFTKTLETEDSPFLGVIAFSYIDAKEANINSLTTFNEDSNFIGRVRVLKALDNNKPAAGIYLTINDQEVIDDPKSTFEFKENTIENLIVKDLRLIDNLSFKSVVEPEPFKFSAFSPLYLSDTPSNIPKGLFILNVDKFLRENSVLYRLLSSKENRNLNSSLANYSKILSIKLLRRLKNVNDVVKKENYEQLLISSKENKSFKTLISTKNEDAAISEINYLYNGNNKNYFRGITFSDYSMSEIYDNTYEYGFEIAVLDGSSKFLYNDILGKLISDKNIIKSYLREAQTDNNLGERTNFSNAFYEMFKNKYEEPLSEIITILSRAISLFNPSDYSQLVYLFSSMLNPLTGSVLEIEKVVNLIDEVIYKISLLLDNNNESETNFGNKGDVLSAIDSTIKAKKWFTNVSYFAGKHKATGIEYLNTLDLVQRQKSDEASNGLSVTAQSAFETRVSKEIKKYYLNENTNLGGIITNEITSKFSSFLGGKTLNTNSFAYLSPSMFDINNETYDFMNSSLINNQEFYKEVEIKTKVFTKTNISDKNLSGNYFNELSLDGITINSINKLVRTEKDKKNVSVLYDNNKETSKNSQRAINQLKIDGVFSVFEEAKFDLKGKIDSLNRNNNGFIIKKMLESKKTNEYINKFIENLPLQYKAAIYKQIPEVGGAISTDVTGQASNKNFYSKFKIDYGLVKKVEFLDTIQEKTVIDDQNIESFEEKWQELTKSAILSINKRKYKHVLCRISRYSNDELFVNEIYDDFQIPTYNEYFILDLETQPIQNESDEEFNTKLLMPFTTYNIRPEFFKSEMSIENFDNLNEQINKFVDTL